MAYIDRNPRAHRPFVLTGVALLHLAAGYAIVTGLGVSYIREVMPVFKAQNYKVEPPPREPQPLPKPSASPDDTTTHITAPPRPIDGLSTPGSTIIEVPLPPIGPIADGSDLIRVDPPKPLPTFSVVPKAARPRGNPGAWATTNDYPARDLREGNQGLTRFSLAIGSDGRVEACTITLSSGFPGLDKATCDNVSRRARFDPATDGEGNRVAGTYSGSIRWQIPQD